MSVLACACTPSAGPALDEPHRAALARSSELASLLVAVPPAAPVCNQAISRGPVNDTCASSDPRWVGTPLVATASAAYCHFTWTGNDNPVLSTLKATNRSYQLDCPVVGLQGAATPLDPALWNGLFNVFWRRVGGTRFRPPTASTGKRGNVAVAVVDSAAFPYAASAEDDTFGHGRLMGRVIANLACPLDPLLTSAPTSCPLSLENVLAVPRLPDGSSDWTSGGYFGTRGELARALRTLLATYEKDRQTRPHLVINLSLGWEGTLPPDLAAPLADEAVRLLLVRASCLGAVSIAAAGNRNNGSETGPFYPAAWQTTPGPDADTCALLRPSVVSDASLKQNRPLVYAAAAVDDSDRPLMNARLELPRLLAPGLGAITPDDRGPGHTLVLSGSSLAAAVVSGIAAAVWESASALTGPEVMTKVYEGAVPIPPGVVAGAGTTTLCLGGPPCADQQRRVSLCRALDAVGVTHDACAVLPAGSTTRAKVPPTLPPAVDAGSTPDAGAADAAPADAGALDVAGSLADGADAGPSVPLPPSPTPPCQGAGCPSWTPPFDKTPAVWTQPNGPACPSCVLYACCNWVLGQINPELPYTKLATSTTAWLFTDPVPSGLPYKIAPTSPFWLQSPGGSRAAIAFQFEGDWPGTGVVYSHPQDIPVVSP